MNEKGTAGRFIVIDTNIFAKRTRLLRTSLGQQLLYFAKRKNAKIVVPRVVGIESQRLIEDDISSLAQAARSNLREIRECLGEGPEPDMPTVENVSGAIEKRFKELAPWLHEVPSDDFVAQAAQRVFHKIPPSHKPGVDAFKDSIIWESLLALPAPAEVYFASDDAAAFFDPSDRTALHEYLVAETTTRELTVHAYRGLAELVTELQGGDPAIDREQASKAILRAVGERIIALIVQWKLPPIAIADVAFDPYLTERPGQLHLEFKVTGTAEGVVTIDGSPYEGAYIRLEGSCDYDPDDGRASNPRMTQEALFASDGRQVQANAYMYVDLGIIGPRSAQFTMRKPLEPGQGPSADKKERIRR